MSQVKRINPHKIPDELVNNEALNHIIQTLLPKNYNFEVHKSIWRIKCLKAKHVALQMPEGLLLFATALSEIFKEFGKTDENESIEITILGDVTYGACCVDDFTAKALDVDLMVHYGHSCLIPLQSLSILYVFVTIDFDLKHFVDTVKKHFKVEQHFALVGTIQFVTSIQQAKAALGECGYRIFVPQCMPLSPGEILGCTSPKIEDCEFFIYLGDGRFHLESAMIANPRLPAYQYDPYSKKFTTEGYDHKQMRRNRRAAIQVASKARTFGIILGTLGRQGNPKILDLIRKTITDQGKESFVLLLSEIFPSKLALFGESVDCWVQIACPRLSIDWGTEFDKPILTPYEASVALGIARSWDADLEQYTGDSIVPPLDEKVSYPMDFYAYESRGPWTPNHPENRPQLKSKPIV
ncbi:Diphthamide biosynthesis protein 1 [Cichlidogyrus casuarinus]|uniref:2-(3-amino-3-carboxypropyl)histidine synthase subunit 1 n=1 Tax=Cichlidogyrus casuarinus TaxID=1844966 RepID=A0ABD2PSB3_9PLAT